MRPVKIKKHIQNKTKKGPILKGPFYLILNVYHLL